MLQEDTHLSAEYQLSAVKPPRPGELPTAVQLLGVFQGLRFRDHELYRTARCLVNLHICRNSGTGHARLADLDRRRAELMDEIDEWSIRQLPIHRNEPVIRPESLGRVIDRLADAWARANRDSVAAPTSRRTTQMNWLRLAELVGGYNNLLADVRTVQDRLPSLAS
ncbi:MULTISPECIES: DUF4254 domain-containing protein [Nocardia]|uniref:DUF4254 domain-containing protein n=1 Tax=Nocardia TaxID=1817 RepID=UPI001892D772|nr:MULTISPECIES: DUF4254 domain-containing protein [Nocardia]MBF6351718.1 DUF4254 domain-containing protein [Nocardia flavorosea]